MPKPSPIKELQMYLSPRQAAELAGVSLRTLWVWITRAYNPLPASKIRHRRLIKRTVLEQWIDSQTPAQEEIDMKAVVERVFSEIKNKKN